MSNKYFEEYTPEEYKQLAVALTLANAKLSDMYMLKQHSDFQILQSRITEQVNKAEALRQIKENELTLNPKVISYLFNSPAQEQQQAQQQLQQIQNPAPVGIPVLPPVLPPVVDGEQKEEGELIEEKADAPYIEDEDEKDFVDGLNTDMETIGYAKQLEVVKDKIERLNENELNGNINRVIDDLSLKGLSENVRKLFKEEKKLTEEKLNAIQIYDEQQVDELNADYANTSPMRELQEFKNKIDESSNEEVNEILQNSRNILQRLTNKGLSDTAKTIHQGIVVLAEKRLLGDDKPAKTTKPAKLKRKDYEDMIREKLGDVPNLSQSGMIKVEGLIYILEQDLDKDEADKYIRAGKKRREEIRDEMKKLNRRLIKLGEPATPVLRRTATPPSQPKPDASRPATNIPVLADEKRGKKSSGKGLKYKKTPKKLLMLGSAHAGNNNKKMLKMLKRKK
jgi:hypothetical protein